MPELEPVECVLDAPYRALDLRTRVADQQIADEDGYVLRVPHANAGKAMAER